MFNQLCNYIDIQLLSNVNTISGNEVTLLNGFTFDRIVSEIKPDWSESPGVSNSGTIYNQTFKINADKLNTGVSSKYAVNIPVVAILYDDNGQHVLGDFDQLARITIIPQTDSDSIQITRQTTTPIY